MKWIRLIAQLMVWLTVASGHAETIRFAPLPMQDRETVIKQFRPMTLYPERQLNVKLVYDDSDNYGDLLEKFRRSQVDLAHLGPLPYVELCAAFPHAKPLVHFDNYAPVRERLGDRRIPKAGNDVR